MSASNPGKVAGSARTRQGGVAPLEPHYFISQKNAAEVSAAFLSVFRRSHSGRGLSTPALHADSFAYWERQPAACR